MDGDGNCFFRSIAVIISGQQSQHGQLRQSVANHIRSNYESIFAHADAVVNDIEAACKCADNISKLGTWAAEDAILATAHYLQRAILVHVGSKQSSPLAYTPTNVSPAKEPIRIAFYEQGHYRPVFRRDMASHDSASSLDASTDDMMAAPSGNEPSPAN